MDHTAIFVAELVGTWFLTTLGCGVVANVALSRTKGHNGGWIVISAGWGLAVTVGVYASNPVSGGHLNPAVTLAMALLGKTPWDRIAVYVAGQMLGAFAGGATVWLAYWPHWRKTADPAAMLGVFCTAPAIRVPWANLLTEFLGTFVLVLGVLLILTPENLSPDGELRMGLGPLLVGMLVWSIGLSLGGPTGYAINPARDFGPRLAHALLPIHGKGSSDWHYAWVPIVGPLLGGAAGALVYPWLR